MLPDITHRRRFRDVRWADGFREDRECRRPYSFKDQLAGRAYRHNRLTRRARTRFRRDLYWRRMGCFA